MFEAHKTKAEDIEAPALAGAVMTYKGRGVLVPEGMRADVILEAAWMLERCFDIAPFLSRQMVRAVLEVSEAMNVRSLEGGGTILPNSPAAPRG